MRDVVLALDIDGTIMHSRKHYMPDDVCVEVIEGEDCGFMSWYMLKTLEKALSFARLVPVTSRSIEQYMRIAWPESIKPDEAFVANGALLLKARFDNTYEKTAVIDINNEEYMHDLKVSLEILSADFRFRNPRIVDGCYAMAVIKDGFSAYDVRDVGLCLPRMKFHCEGKKCYLYPRTCNKGAAIKYIKTIQPDALIFCGGDSDNDVSMKPFSDMSVFLFDGKSASIQSSVHNTDSAQSFEKVVIRSIRDFVDNWARQDKGSIVNFEAIQANVAYRQSISQSGLMKPSDSRRM